MKLTKADYVARISAATPLMLTIITYELVLTCINEAKEAINVDNSIFSENIKKAQQFNCLLMEALDFEKEISLNLMSLYIYVDKLLVKALFDKNTQPLDEATQIMSKLLEGWQQVNSTITDTTPVMKQSKQIFAGLTFKNGELEEFVLDSEKGGFKA